MDKVIAALQSYAKLQKAKDLSRFFKTGAGEYGEGDKFLGIVVPIQRKIIREFWNKITLNDTEKLLQNPYHECRLTALLILVAKYKKGSGEDRTKIVKMYSRNTRYINNWDLVDLSARDIIGAYYFDKPKHELYKLARSKLLWERRIAIIATSYFIGKHQFDDTLKIAEILLHDKHDLVHKAVGWMLREVGKRDQKAEEQFLQKHHKVMPRTMLRYAIEKFDEEKRKYYMSKIV